VTVRVCVLVGIILAAATEQTDVYIAYDSERLYFGIYAHYSDPTLVRANRADRDQTENDDTVTVSFDPFRDQQLGYSFSVNGYGVQGDSVLKGNTGPGGTGAAGTGGAAGGGASTTATGDTTWNALFASAGQLVDDGWTAEMSIPFKSLRYPARGAGEPHRWGFQIERQIRANNEVAHWAPMSRGVAGFLRQMGTLDGITGLSTSRNFEVLPTFTAVQASTLNRITGVYGPSDLEEGGVNVKYGLTSNLTFDFTYNPDFSQIESDRQQIQVNLRFPISFPELRPFFLEGIDNFRVGGPATIIHTRTIVDPQYGAKLTGKVGKTTLGFQVANDEAPGKVDDSRDPAFGQDAQVVLARARYDFRPQSWVGAVFTDREFLDTYSRLAGVDAPLQFGQNTLLRLLWNYSDQQGTDGVKKTGYSSEVYFRKDGRNLTITSYHYRFSPGYGTALGFVSRVDQQQTGANVSYKWWPESWVVNWGPQFSYSRNYDFRGNLQNENKDSTVNVQFARNISASAVFNDRMERYREIPFNKNRFSVSGNVSASRRILFTGKIDKGDEIRFTVNPYLGRNTIYGVTATFRPFSRLQSVINVDTTNFVDVRSDTQVFNVKIFRAQTTYQFTPRLLLRNIMERNTFDQTLGANVLVTYRVNSGTVFYVGYDDHYAEGSAINPQLFEGPEFRRTDRAIFTKVQYLFRSGGSN
jgi:hypothetical protein